MTEKWFSELNLEKLKMFASNWGQAFNVIEKITLYSGSYGSGVRYVLVATAPPFPGEEAREKLQSDTHISAQGENIPVVETIDYYKWVQEDCSQIEDDLRLAYHASGYTRDDWMWFPIEAGEENKEIMALTDHVLINDNFFVTLYEKFKQKRNVTPNQEDKKDCQEIAKMIRLKLSDYYQHLDPTELKVMADGWANEFSVIKQIVLYRTKKVIKDYKYVLYVRVDDSDKIEYRYFEEYWIDKDCYLDRLRDAYITPNTDYCGDWLFLLPEGEGEPLPEEGQVNTKSRLVLFPRDDERLIEEHKPSQISNDKERKQLSEQDVDAFVRELTVIPESNLEIKIKKPKKKPETYNHDRLGFKDNTATEWEIFLKILNNSGSYSIGQAGTPDTDIRKEYNQKLSYLRAIDKKLKHAFHKDFSLQFPGGYHLYERFKTEGRGVYKFKFRVELSLKPADRSLKAKYEKCPKDTLLEHLKNIGDQYARTLEKGLKLQIDTIKEALLEKHKMTDDDIKDYFDPKSDHEEINNDFSNFAKSESTI